jgi:hypothetical protein
VTPSPTPSAVYADQIIKFGALGGGGVAVLGLMGSSIPVVVLGIVLAALSVLGGMAFKIWHDKTAHQRSLDTMRHNPEVQLARIKAKTGLLIQQARGPQELRQAALQLQQNVQTFLIAAWDRRDRDPAFADHFALLRPLIQQVNQTTADLTDDIISGKNLTPEQIEERTAFAYQVAMTMFDKVMNRG